MSHNPRDTRKYPRTSLEVPVMVSAARRAVLARRRAFRNQYAHAECFRNLRDLFADRPVADGDEQNHPDEGAGQIGEENRRQHQREQDKGDDRANDPHRPWRHAQRGIDAVAVLDRVERADCQHAKSQPV